MESFNVRVSVDVDLDEFDDEDVIEYVRSLGYNVTKVSEPDPTGERIPEYASNPDQYVTEFCRLNGMKFVMPAAKRS